MHSFGKLDVYRRRVSFSLFHYFGANEWTTMETTTTLLPKQPKVSSRPTLHPYFIQSPILISRLYPHSLSHPLPQLHRHPPSRRQSQPRPRNRRTRHRNTCPRDLRRRTCSNLTDPAENSHARETAAVFGDVALAGGDFVAVARVEGDGGGEEAVAAVALGA